MRSSDEQACFLEDKISEQSNKFLRNMLLPEDIGSVLLCFYRSLASYSAVMKRLTAQNTAEKGFLDGAHTAHYGHKMASQQPISARSKNR